MDINPLKTLCGCPCNGVIIFFKSTCAVFSPSGMCLSMYNNIAHAGRLPWVFSWGTLPQQKGGGTLPWSRWGRLKEGGGTEGCQGKRWGHRPGLAAGTAGAGAVVVVVAVGSGAGIPHLRHVGDIVEDHLCYLDSHLLLFLGTQSVCITCLW